MSASASTPRASTPASRRRPSSSPRPQPTSSTGAASRKFLHVDALALADGLGRAAHPRLVGEVVGKGGRGRLRGDGLRRSRSASRGGPALDPGEALLELGQRPSRRLLARSGEVGALGQLVHELEQRVVVAALLGCERLDVPAHKRPQSFLDAVGDEAPHPLLPPDRPLGRHGPHALGLVSPGQARAAVSLHRRGAAPAHLLLQPGEEPVHVDLFRRQNPCRSRGFVGLAGHRRIIAGGCYGKVSG